MIHLPTKKKTPAKSARTVSPPARAPGAPSPKGAPVPRGGPAPKKGKGGAKGAAPAAAPPGGPADLRTLVEEGKRRGYVTYDELNRAIPDDQSDKAEALMASLEEMGIEIVEEPTAGEATEEAGTEAEAEADGPAEEAEGDPDADVDAETEGEIDGNRDRPKK